MHQENTPPTDQEIADKLTELNKAYRGYQNAKTQELRQRTHAALNTCKKWFTDHKIPYRYVSIGDKYILAPREQEDEGE